VTVGVRSGESTVYTFINPAIDNADCSVSENSLIQVEQDTVSNPSALYFSASCSDPCSIIKSSLLSFESVITFTIDSDVTSIISHTSPQITINVVCDANSVTISNAVGPATFELLHNFVGNNTLSFPEFTCSLSSCCDLTYFASSSEDSVVPIPSMADPTASGGQIDLTIPVTDVGLYEVYIHVSNAEGVTSVSNLILAEVITDCRDYPAEMTTTAPNDEETAQASPGKYLV